MRILGLTGGIASGKSTAATQLKELGAIVLDADRYGHRVYEQDTPGFHAVVNEFGHDLVGEDGEIDRRVLGGKVFGDPAQMKRLTDIVWPEIRRLAAEEIAEIRDREPATVIVLEAAVLIEAEWQDLGDEVWVIIVEPELAKKRLMERNRLSEEQAEARIGSQLTNKERLEHADVSIKNSGSLEEFGEAIQKEWDRLQRRIKQAGPPAGCERTQALTTTPEAAPRRRDYKQIEAQEFRLTEEPYYLAVSDEVDLFEIAYEEQIPVLLKAPRVAARRASSSTCRGACTSTSATRPGRAADHRRLPRRPQASDLIGRYLLEGDETVWIDGPITRAVKAGAICYLDEIVEARKDTAVLIHPLTDYRRLLPIDKRGQLLEAAEGFLLVLSYNPGYQSALKDLKHSTRQRFVAIEFGYPPRDQEAEIVRRESGCGAEDALELAKLGEKVRNLKEHGLAEGVSTRLLVYAGRLMSRGISARRACQTAVVWGLTDETEVQRSIEEVVTSIFPE